MYKIIILSLLLISCSSIPVHSDFNTKFKKNQVVYYKVPEFYKLVCSGKGVINDVNFSDSGEIIYQIFTTKKDAQDEYDKEPGCPYDLFLIETDIHEEEIGC